jgi:hypothetical protein
VNFQYQLSLPADKATIKFFTTSFRKADQFDMAGNSGTNNTLLDLTEMANGLYYFVFEVEAGGKHEQKIGKLILAR